MNTRSILSALVGLAALGSVPASALFDAELLYGRRWYEIKPKQGDASGVQGSDVYIGAHLDPIPLVPVAFGASVSLIDLKKEDLGGNVKEAKVIEPALDVMAWVPMVPVITPYVKIKVPILAKYAYTENTTSTTGTGTVESAAIYKLSGYHLNVGAKYSPLPLIKILLEGGLGMQKAEADEVKIGGTKVSTTGDMDLDMNSKYLALGVEIGI
jgi:hypothetical protein